MATFSLPGVVLEKITQGISPSGVAPWAFLTPPAGSLAPVTIYRSRFIELDLRRLE